MGSGASKTRSESPPTKQPPTTRIETPATSLGSSAPTTPGGAAGPSDERDSSSFKETRTDDQYVIQFKPEEVTHDDINSSPSGSFPKKAAGEPEDGGSSVKGESFARRRLSVPDPKDLEKPLSARSRQLPPANGASRARTPPSAIHACESIERCAISASRTSAAAQSSRRVSSISRCFIAASWQVAASASTSSCSRADRSLISRSSRLTCSLTSSVPPGTYCQPF